MTYLLDTHVWLWLLTEPARLDEELLHRLQGADSLLLSAASTWEIAIKSELGKLELPEPASTFVPTRMRRSGVEALPIAVAHSLAAGSLPAHHRDPFDRLLIAQSQLMTAPLVSADRQLAPYETEIVWV